MCFLSVFFEPTDVVISKKPFACGSWKAIKFISPNLTELKTIADLFKISLPSHINNQVEQASYLTEQLSRHIDTIIVTLGKHGLLIARHGEASAPFLHTNRRDRLAIRHYPVDEMDKVVNVSGAGDCLAAGLISAMLDCCSEELCVSVGIIAAQASLHSKSAVPDVLFNRKQTTLKPATYYNILSQ